MTDAPEGARPGTDRLGAAGDGGPGARTLAPLYAAGFVTAFGAHAVAANLGGYATSRHTSLWELGLLLGVYDAAEVVLKPVFGAVVDRRGAKVVMLAGLVAFALASAAFALAGRAHWLGAARLGQGCAAAAFSPAAGAALAQLGGKKRTGRLFGGYGGAKSIGYLLGPVAGGALVAAGGYRTLFAVTGAVAVIAAAGVAVAVPKGEPTGRRPMAGITTLVEQLGRASFLRPVLLLAAGTGALSAAVGFLPLVGARHHLGPVATGAMVSLLALTAALVQPWAGRRHDAGRLAAWAPSAALIGAGVGFLVAAGFPGAAGICAAAVLIGIGVAVVTPVGFALLAAGSPPERMGRTMGAGEVGRELGDAGGPVLVGAFGVVGLGAGLAALAAALVASAGLALPGRSRPATGSGEEPEPIR